jgi:hypothetical protein
LEVKQRRGDKMEIPATLSQNTTVEIQSVYYRVNDPAGKIAGIQVDKLPDGRIIQITEMPIWPFVMMPDWNK